MSAVGKSFISEQEYLDLERQAPHKSDYYHGEIFAIAGASKEHNKIVPQLFYPSAGIWKGVNVLFFQAI